MDSQRPPPFYLMHPLTEKRVYRAIIETARDSGVLPSASILNRPTDFAEWQRTVLNGYCVALDISRSTLLREVRQLGGPLVSYLGSVLLSTPVLAALTETYIDRIFASAGLEDDSDLRSFSDAQFFLFYLGSLFARDGDLAKSTAKSIFARLVHAALRIKEYDTYKYLRDPRIPAPNPQAELAVTRARHEKLLDICHSVPQPEPVPSAASRTSLLFFYEYAGFSSSSGTFNSAPPEDDDSDSDFLDPDVTAADIFPLPTTSSLVAAELSGPDSDDELDADEVDGIARDLEISELSIAVAPAIIVPAIVATPTATSSASSTAEVEDSDSADEDLVAAAITPSSSNPSNRGTLWTSPAMKRKARDEELDGQGEEEKEKGPRKRA
ncbi:hypothetical protein EV122DRAFT_283607 [Schizophyllum commune]